MGKSRKLSTISLKKHRCESSRCFQNPSSDLVVVQFCHDTSLHGLKYVGQKNRHVSERIFWLIAFISGIFFAAYLISDVWNKYRSNPVFVAFAPTELSISKLPLPALTVCNMNRIQKDVVLEIRKNAISQDPLVKAQALEEIEMVKAICGANPSMSKLMTENDNPSEMDPDPSIKYNGSRIIDFLFKASQPCHDMIQRCFFGDMEFPCVLEFYPVVTESGMCCSLNMMPATLLLHYPDTFEPHNMKGSNFGTTSGGFKGEQWDTTKFMDYYNAFVKQWAEWDYRKGFVLHSNKLGVRPFSPQTSGKSNSVSLLLYPDLENYFCTSSDSMGFLVAAHKPMECPRPVDFGMVIPPGGEVFGILIPQLTQADDSISSVSIDSRACYFPDEYPLKYYKIYTETNCEDECIANFTIRECGCARYYHPRESTTRVCEELDLPCWTNVSGTLREEIGHICDYCYPLCNELDYRISTSLSALQDHSTLWPITENENISNSTWYGKPVTILNVFFGERTTVAKVRKRLFGSTDLIANVGGLLGLCLGFSGLSFVEIIYFCTMRTWFQRRRLKHLVVEVVLKFMNALRKPKEEVQTISPEENIMNTRNKLPIPMVRAISNGKPEAVWDMQRNLNRIAQNKYYF